MKKERNMLPLCHKSFASMPEFRTEHTNYLMMQGTAELTKVSLPCGRTMVFSRLLITILHSSLSTRFNTVFSHTVANSVNLQDIGKEG